MRNAKWKIVSIFIAITMIFTSIAMAPAPVSQANIGPTLGSLKLVAEGFAHPIALKEAPDNSGRLFVVDQTGQVWIITKNGEKLSTPFLDISGLLPALDPGYDERGLLDIAFHPDYAMNGRFFVYYSEPLRPTAPPDFNHTNVLAEYHVSASDPNVADPNSGVKLLEMDHPYMNHNGGTIEFGPSDGYLYLAVGDGGNADDVGIGHVEDWYPVNEGGNGQDVEQNLLGSMLRLNVNTSGTYSVPADNPYTGIPGVLPEQWAYGFRNPFRFSFDMAGGHELYLGDSGQNLWEEVDRVTKGGNYGWNVKEGAHCFSTANPDESLPSCPNVVGAGSPLAGDPLIDPIIDFANAEQPGGLGNVVIGGYVYRGTQVPYLRGRYLFGVFSQGEAGEPGAVFIAKMKSQKGSNFWFFRKARIHNMQGFELPGLLLSFGQDRRGEVYVLTTNEFGPTGTTGKVWMIVRPRKNVR